MSTYGFHHDDYNSKDNDGKSGLVLDL